MKKRFFATILAVLLTVTALPLLASAESTPASGTMDALSWTFNSAAGKLTITGSGAMKNYNGSSQKSPFYGHSDIRTVEIGYGVTSVGDYAFYGCGQLRNISLPEETMETIGKSAFEGNTQLEAILIPSGVETLGENCFRDCAALATVGMGSGVRTIKAGAFRGCTKLWDVYVEGGEEFFDTLHVSDNNEPLQNSNPITECEFGRCGETQIWFYDGVDKTLTVLGEGEMEEFDYDMNPAPFSYLEAKKAVIGKSVGSVSDWAFYDLPDLEEISVEAGSAYLTVENRALYDAKKTRLIAFPNKSNAVTLRIPEGVAEIAPGAAGNAKKLFQVFVPKSMKTVGYGAFEYCEALKEVYYTGTKLAWDKIEIGDANDPLLNASRWYTIDSIMLSIAAPAAGETPIRTYIIPALEGKFLPYQVNGVSWTPDDATFQNGKTYTVTFLVTAKEGYRMPAEAKDLAATVNGKPALCRLVEIQTGAVKRICAEVSFTFPTLQEFMLGDVDNDTKITASDARLALRRAVDLETYAPGSREFRACDVDKDGSVTANDARSILRAAVDLEDPAAW